MNILNQIKDNANVKYDLAAMENNRNRVLTKLFENPENFANTLYTTKKSGFIWTSSEIFSPYLMLDREEFCCLLKTLTPSDIQNVDINSKPPTCFLAHVTKIESTDNTGYNVELKNEKFFIKTLKVTAPYIYYFSDALVINSKLQNFNICNAILNNINVNYIGSDNFTNSILIGYILNLINDQYKADTGLNGIIRTYGATICQESKTGLLLLEYLNGNSFNTYISKNLPTKSFVLNIFKQLVVNLDFLWTRAYFNHGNLLSGKLAIMAEPLNVTYKNVKINSSVTVKIGDFENAALTIKRTDTNYLRLFAYDTYTATYFKLNNFNPTLNVTANKVNNYYILSSYFNAVELGKIRHMGIPFYSSFDLYTILISLLVIPSIYNIVFNDNDLSNIFFRNMWYPEDISPVYIDIKKIVDSNRQKPPTFDDILKILHGRKLKCNLTAEMLEVLSRL